MPLWSNLLTAARGRGRLFEAFLAVTQIGPFLIFTVHGIFITSRAAVRAFIDIWTYWHSRRLDTVLTLKYGCVYVLAWRHVLETLHTLQTLCWENNHRSLVDCLSMGRAFLLIWKSVEQTTKLPAAMTPFYLLLCYSIVPNENRQDNELLTGISIDSRQDNEHQWGLVRENHRKCAIYLSSIWVSKLSV